MFSRALNLVSRSRASQHSTQNDIIPDDVHSEGPLTMLDPRSATCRALAIPEILIRVGHSLDRSSLLSSIVVSQYFYESLLPVLWFAVQLRLTHPRLSKMTKSLEKNLSRIRFLTINDIQAGTSGRDSSDDSDEDHNDQNSHEERNWRRTRESTINEHNQRLKVLEILKENDISLLQYLTLDCSSPTHGISPFIIFLNIYPNKLSGLRHLDIGPLSTTRDKYYIYEILNTYPLLETLRIIWSAHNLMPILIEDQELLIQEQEQQQPIFTKKLAIRRLSLIGLQWPEQEFLLLVKQCPQLEDITIVGPSKSPWNWTLSTIDQFAEFCPHITRIHIAPGYGSCFEDSLLARILEVFSGIRAFCVPRCDFGSETFMVLKSRIAQIEELNVAFTRKPGVDSRMLVQLMTQAHNLRYLDASGVSLDPWLFYVTPLHERQQQQQLKQQQNGEEQEQDIVLDWGRIRPQSMLKVAPWACHRLETISIGFATLQINQRQCQAIYAHLSYLPHLRRIHILPNHFPIKFEAGLEQLVTLRQLTHFDVHGTEREIPEEVIKWMGTAWPNLKMLRLYIESRKTRTIIRGWLKEVGRDDVHIATH